MCWLCMRNALSMAVDSEPFLSDEDDRPRLRKHRELHRRSRRRQDLRVGDERDRIWVAGKL
jgi:hypothetical protein